MSSLNIKNLAAKKGPIILVINRCYLSQYFQRLKIYSIKINTLHKIILRLNIFIFQYIFMCWKRLKLVKLLLHYLF